MNRKIKIYSIVLAVIYVSMITYHVFKGVDDFKAGFEMGKSGAETDKHLEIYHFRVEPVKGRYTFPSAVMNLLTNKPMNIEASEYKVKLSATDNIIPKWISILNVLKTIFSLFVLIILIYIPVLFFSVIRSATKDRIIDGKVIGKIKRIGWLLIGFFIYDFVFFKLLEPITARYIIQFKDYNIVSDFSDLTVLILGLVTLIMGEILNISLRLKEDQELTI